MNALEKQFAQTAAEHKSTIYTVCYMFSQDADEVNDLFQEVLVNLWKGFENFEHRSDIKTWIYRVALNTCISIDTKKRRAATARLTMDINLFEDRDEDTRQVDMLHKRISRLQPFDRAIVLLWLENTEHIPFIRPQAGRTLNTLRTSMLLSVKTERPIHISSTTLL